MKKDLLNISLAITGILAVIALAFFVIKLKNLSENESVDKKTETSASANEGKNTSKTSDGDIENLKNITGKNTGSGDVEPEKQEVVILAPTSTPTPTPSPSPTPTPTPTPVVNTGNIDPSKPIVALSFDDGPSTNTTSILETLEKYGAHATFFMVGENIDMYPDLVRAVYESGNEIGNHTINHANLKTLSASEIRKEVEGNQDKLNKILGTDLKFIVRPPYGNVNDTVKSTVEHPLIIWSVDTLDWRSRDAQQVLEEVKKSTKNGSIILMHDLYKSTAEAAKLVVPWLVEQGYQICSVSEMYAACEVQLENGKTYNGITRR
jgi:peptidoglycan/xylan/chitin deacetylase (PgdA/CDA1 family)